MRANKIIETIQSGASKKCGIDIPLGGAAKTSPRGHRKHWAEVHDGMKRARFHKFTLPHDGAFDEKRGNKAPHLSTGNND